MRRTTSARLSVNPLEGREVPACVITHPTPDTVVITGDGANDTVYIRDNGAGVITGSATGAGVFGFVGIKNIRVVTGDGSDKVSYNLVGPLQPGQSRDVTVSLGSSPWWGTDQFVANLYNPATGLGSDLRAGSHLGITVFGGEGRDVIFVNAFKDTDVAVGAEFHVGLYGQAGNDLIATHYSGENDGSVKLLADGGSGHDRISSRFTEALGSSGVLDAVVRGWDGNDTLGLKIFSPKAPAQAVLDGGAGYDFGVATANVTKVDFP